MKHLRGVLLDVDGTLVDSNDAHACAWFQAMSEAGVPSDLATVRRLIGKGGDKLLPEVSGIEADSPRGKAISDRRGEIFQKEFLPSLRPFPGAKELLARLKKEGLRLAVASSSKKEELKGLLRVCGADGSWWKPAPRRTMPTNPSLTPTSSGRRLKVSICLQARSYSWATRPPLSKPAHGRG